MLYEMLTRQQPFRGETMTDVLANVINREPGPVRTLRQGELPTELERIITRTVRKNRRRALPVGQGIGQRFEAAANSNAVDAELIRTGEAQYVGQSQEAGFLNAIAVLPFANISAEKENEYFSEGLTEEIIMNLSKLHSLKVVASGATMRYAKEGKSHRQTADDLGVQYLLEGSVRRQGKDLRITAQLIDAMHDVYLWAETYRGTIEDIFDIQEKVAGEIVQALQLRLSSDEKQILKKRFTKNTEAYQLYLQGRFFWNKRSEDGVQTAIKYFEAAIEKIQRYALAWAGIADSYNVLGEYGNIPAPRVISQGEAAVFKALEIDNRLAEVHTSYASLLLLSKWDWVNSEREFKLALELNPNYATAHHWYSQWLWSMGRLEEALQVVSRAAELDPVSQAFSRIKDWPSTTIDNTTTPSRWPERR